MTREIDRTNIEQHLGEQVEVLQGAEKILGIGVLAYEHNTGRLSIYTADGKQLRAFLKGNEVLRFLKTPSDIYNIPRDINNLSQSD